MIEPLPFTNTQASGFEVLAGGGALSMNVVTEPTGSVRRRPGIKTHASATSDAIDSNGLDSIYVTHSGKMYVSATAVSSYKELYRVTAGGSAQLSATPTSSVLDGTERPTIAETEALLVYAAGGKPQKIDLVTDASARLGGSTVDCTHIIANDTRLICNNLADTDKDNFYFSSKASGTATSGHEEWPGDGTGTASFGTTGGRPDPIKALAEATNEIFVWGATTLQVFAPDYPSLYAPLAAREYGCAAPYGIVKIDQSFMWIDNRRRFVFSDGRSYDDQVGAPVQKDLNAMTTVSDAFGYRVHLDNTDAAVWTFPSEGKTYVYQKGSGWGQWSGWDDTLTGWKRFIVNCHHQRPDTGANVVGTTDGKIGEFDHSTYTDLGDTIVARIDTGFLNRGTDKRKFCRAIYLSLKRGETTSSSTPVAWVSWRDEGGSWGQAVPVELGAPGEREIVYPIRSLGTYRRRQWRFEFSGPEELVLANAEEDFEVLGD